MKGYWLPWRPFLLRLLLLQRARAWGSCPHCLLISFPPLAIGISGKSQILFALVFTTRYLDLLTNFISIYNTVMKVRRWEAAAVGPAERECLGSQAVEPGRPGWSPGPAAWQLRDLGLGETSGLCVPQFPPL